MSNLQSDAVYISAGCNRTPKSLDWGGPQNQLAFAQCHSVALMSQEEPFQIKCTFHKHTDLINCVKWIEYSSSSTSQTSSHQLNEFVSASKDKTVVVWQGRDYQYEPRQVLTGHKSNVSVVDSLYSRKDDQLTTYLASASLDSTVNIWTRTGKDVADGEFSLTQTITCKQNGFAIALKFYTLPVSNQPLLLVGYDNHKIELYVRVGDNLKFQLVNTLIGHEDWIRDIDVCQPSDDHLLIASSSQDNYIRLWKMHSTILDELNDAFKVPQDQVVSVEESDEEDEDEVLHQKKSELLEEELKLKSSLFNVPHEKKYIQYSINLESVLYGHEDWIYTVKFHPRLGSVQPLKLISASMDKTLVVWSYNEENSVWIDIARAGELGGNLLGFYGAAFDKTGKYIVAHGYQGSLHLWRRDGFLSNQTSKYDEMLTSAVINSGHFDLVEDLSWEPEQQYFVSVSKDQTARFHSYWRDSPVNSWHEIGRPQIHGYDLKCVSFINRYKFVSGADEKLLRVFESPRIFLENYCKLTQDEKALKFLENSQNESCKLPKGASVPALGLSNKAVFEEENKKDQADKDSKKPNLAEELYKEVYFHVVDLNKPPNEEHLLQNTLWPEVQKLYGHGYELFTVAVDPVTKTIASACKASKPEHAGILLWHEETINNQLLYKSYKNLTGHELTIVQLKFSNNGDYLLSVSRDRSWKLYAKPENTTSGPPDFQLVRAINTKNPYHTRIIWACDWSHDDKFFVTVSRDKRACVWATGRTSSSEGEKPATPLLELSDSITACAFGPQFTSDNNYLIAFGLENGSIELYKWNPENGFIKAGEIEKRFTHHLTVKKLSFRRILAEQNSDKRAFHLASCSDDYSTRLFKVTC